jgi:hypothetical protein
VVNRSPLWNAGRDKDEKLFRPPKQSALHYRPISTVIALLVAGSVVACNWSLMNNMLNTQNMNRIQIV